jgi:signal transduction histidine kinase
MSESAPLFGQDERDVAERLLLIAGLALDRANRAHMLEISNQDLAAANDELQAFVYSASHDLKNPLIALLGYVDLLKSDNVFEEGSEAAMFIERIEANGWFMSALIQDLLELSRIGRIEEHEEPVDLEQVVGTASETVTVEYPTLQVVVGSALPTLLASRTRVQQLVTNVLANAGRHGGEGVEVVITAEPDEHGLTRIVFQDTGPGVDPAHARRIFRLFERLETGSSDGTGIGLTICRKIAQSLGGDMVLEDSSAGARFVATVAPTHVVSPSTPEAADTSTTTNGHAAGRPALTAQTESTP